VSSSLISSRAPISSHVLYSSMKLMLSAHKDLRLVVTMRESRL
jgi:hypothetical protein